ncbi:hypothetical protein ABZ621_37495 [Streptomyces sp. NPDC007863]|uniref:hypothetical protein n=1 Tax=Streptomyces sp. NPDC007863 TaxID=3154894 RepID=UPI003401CB06
MKTCARCGYRITGTPVEYMPDSASGARPSTYHHATDEECNTAASEVRPGATYTSRLSRYLGQ